MCMLSSFGTLCPPNNWLWQCEEHLVGLFIKINGMTHSIGNTHEEFERGRKYWTTYVFLFIYLHYDMHMKFIDSSKCRSMFNVNSSKIRFFMAFSSFFPIFSLKVYLQVIPFLWHIQFIAWLISFFFLNTRNELILQYK